MKKQVMLMACTAMLLSVQNLSAQTEPLNEASTVEKNSAKDDIVQRSILQEKQPLAYPPLREADILWEQDLWRIVDVREKINLPFVYPNAPLFSILTEAIETGTLAAYSVENEHFNAPYNTSEFHNMMVSKDTIMVIDPNTYDEIQTVVENSMNWEDVKRFRIKEKWYFDKNTSTMKVRILGIAPMREFFDNQGNFRYEAPMFWVNYAEARPVLAQNRVFNMGGNQSTKTTWEDLFEMRRFSSYVYKDQNVYDRRLEDYLSGTDALVAGKNIELSIQNMESDFWSR